MNMALLGLICHFVKTKTEVAKLGLELNAPIEITYSCQVNSDMPCGACPNCVDRINAIK